MKEKFGVKIIKEVFKLKSKKLQVLNRKALIEDYKNCLEATQHDNKII